VNLRVVAATGWRLAHRSVWSGGRARQGAVPLVLTVLMIATSSAVSTLLFAELARAGAPAEWSRRLLGWGFTLAFVILVLNDLRGAVYALVLAGDLGRLRAAPIARHEMLALKLGETLPRTLPPVVGIALPVAVCYAIAGGPLHVSGLVVALFSLWAVPVGAGVTIALLLLAVAPASRVRESLTAFATFAFVGGWLLNAFWMPRLLASGAGVAPATATMPAPPAWSPATWAGIAAGGPAPQAFAAAIACAGASILALALAAWAATRLLAGVHAQALPAGSVEVKGGLRRAPTLALAFLRRDAALVTRDWPVLFDATANMALWSLLPLAALPLAPIPTLELARALVVALALSFGNDVAARALPLERASLAWARLSPVGGARWARLRMLGVAIAGAITLVLALAVVGCVFHLRGAALLDVSTFAVAAAAVAAGTGLLAGAILGDPDWNDPRAMLGTGGRTLTAIALVAESALWLAISHGSPAAPLAAPKLVGVLLSAGGAMLLCLAMTARRLESPVGAQRG